jgi:hypothetical protein
MGLEIPMVNVPRCRHCGSVLEHFEDDAYCPDCTAYEPTEPDLVKLIDTDPDVERERAEWQRDCWKDAAGEGGQP